MGGRSSKEASWRQTSFPRSNSSSPSGYQPPYGQESFNYAPQPSYSSPQDYPSSQEYVSQDYGGGQAPDNRAKLERRYSRIADNYNSLEQVQIPCIM
jgi:E3 ubiquitin-protein ligase RGLG